MIVGVDFDNTIVNYDRLFHRVAVDRGLIPEQVRAAKGDVRDYLRRIGGENDWIELQGYVYGVRMHEADPFPGVIDFFARCRREGVPVRIISHKTLQPFAGPGCNLHEAAQRWLREHGFYDGEIDLGTDDVWFELTKAAKLQRVRSAGCSHFIDDLPELLAEQAFPEQVERVLFDPNTLHPASPFARAGSWVELNERLLGAVGSVA